MNYHHNHNKLINFVAISTNLTIRTSQRAKVSHFDHGTGKVLEERSIVGAIGCDQRVSGTTTKELLIGVKKAFFVDEVLVISIIEHNTSGHIKWREVIVVAKTRTL